jgi:LPXTG-site transpeptidase (sortase) family protein
MGLSGGDGVHTLAFDSSGDLLAGGGFTNAGGDPDADNIALWDVTTQTWSWPAGMGLNSGVRDLAFDSSGDLYAGGQFTDAGGDPDADYIAFFLLNPPPVTLPGTGFAPGILTARPSQPALKAYIEYGGLWLEIPRLGVEMPIVGVTVIDGEWDVSWLGNSAGYLNGTAFPTLPGNTGITAHVWDANNNPGPFAELKKLQYGDEVRIHAWGQVYTYEVRYNYQVNPGNLYPLHHEEYDWVTLLTCEQWSEDSDEYRFRRVVRAVLVDVSPD